MMPGRFDGREKGRNTTASPASRQPQAKGVNARELFMHETVELTTDIESTKASATTAGVREIQQFDEHNARCSLFSPKNLFERSPTPGVAIAPTNSSKKQRDVENKSPGQNPHPLRAR